ncbi:MAG: hypothetical protein WC809_16155 [Sinimarinibacterium sp.]|jgi:hypothetical protein
MSEHQAPHPGDIYARSVQNHAELAAQHTTQFSGDNIGLSWPDGWHGLVAKVCAYAAEQRITVRWFQIKEKFGSLRMHYKGGPLRADVNMSGRLISIEQESEGAHPIPGLHDQVKEAEAESLRTCCLCGTSEKVAQVKQRRFDGWWLTSCDACAVPIQAYCDLPPSQR